MNKKNIKVYVIWFLLCWFRVSLNVSHWFKVSNKVDRFTNPFLFVLLSHLSNKQLWVNVGCWLCNNTEKVPYKNPSNLSVHTWLDKNFLSVRHHSVCHSHQNCAKQKSVLTFPASWWVWQPMLLSSLSFQAVTSSKKIKSPHCCSSTGESSKLWENFFFPALTPWWVQLIVCFATCGPKPEEDCFPTAAECCTVTDGSVCVYECLFCLREVYSHQMWEFDFSSRSWHEGRVHEACQRNRGTAVFD